MQFTVYTRTLAISRFETTSLQTFTVDPAETGGLSFAVSLRKPELSHIAVCANRLLKFLPPVQRNSDTLRRFIERHLQEPRLPLKALLEWPFPAIEAIASRLWHIALPQAHMPSAANQTLALYLLLEDMIQFDARAWVAADVNALGQTRNRLHGHFFAAPDNRASLETILTAYGYNQAWLAQETLELGYLVSRMFAHTLPWADAAEAFLLEGLGKTLPRLERLVYLHQTLKQDPLYRQPSPTTHTVSETIQTLSERLPTYSSNASARSGSVRPVRLLILAEGTTEERLLPVFAKIMGLDFLSQGVLVEAAGGKSQTSNLYTNYAECLACPVFILLDQDAAQFGQSFRGSLRKGDQLFILSEGEFEDTFPVSVLVDTINRHYDPHPRFRASTFKAPGRRVAELEACWKERGWGAFDKIRFAEEIKNSLETLSPGTVTLSPTLAHLFQAIEETLACQPA